MSGALGTSGKSGSSPNRCSSGLFSTDHKRQSLSKASTVVVDVENGVVGRVVNVVVVVVVAVGGLIVGGPMVKHRKLCNHKQNGILQMTFL
jgi:hypothetical protein